MKYESLVRAILNEIGGEHNIASVTHCMTRLRFTLKDESKANIENVKNITGVVGCVNKGGQFQIVIGTQVADVYNELIQIAHIQTDGEEKKEKKNLISALFDTMASIVMPMIGPLAGAGMIKAILSILVPVSYTHLSSIPKSGFTSRIPYNADKLRYCCIPGRLRCV